MKLMIVSDIHGSAYWCRLMTEAFASEAPDRLILLGDLLYHGPRNALPREYDPASVAQMLNEIREKLLVVRGNCDSEVDELVLTFPIRNRHLWLMDGKHAVFATHGHEYNAENPPYLASGDLLLHGHTHVPVFCELCGGSHLANPGSISIPKEDSPHSYMTIENGLLLWKDLEHDCRVYREESL